MQPKISVLVYTARTGHPYWKWTDGVASHNEDLEVLTLVTETLAYQTFQEFEIVVVDGKWEERGDWFKDHPQPYPVKHVPSSPNVWHEIGRPGLCAQLNRGLAWCDGELVQIVASEVVFPKHFLAKAWQMHQAGLIPVSWYATAQPGANPERAKIQCRPLDIDWRGYTDAGVTGMDHRGKHFYDPQCPSVVCHHQDVYLWTAWPKRILHELNGFDETFDGDFSLLDCDMGNRAELLGYGKRMMLNRDLYNIKPELDPVWCKDIKRGRLIKCNYALWWWNRVAKKPFANVPVRTDWVQMVKDVVCGEKDGACPVRVACRADLKCSEREVVPFCEGNDATIREFWLKSLRPMLLTEEETKRKHGIAPYDRSYVHGC